MSNKFFLIVLLLLIPAVLAATTVTVSKATFSVGEMVTISGTCDAPSQVGMQAQLYGSNVWFEQVATSGAGNAFSAGFVPAQSGDYVVYVACENEASTTATFCVGTAEQCGAVTPADKDGKDTKDGGGSPGNGGSGGGGACFPNWDYGAWSFCNASLQQSREKYDLNNCRTPELEVRDCAVCEESWICSGWSACANGLEQRTCIDEHACNTFALQPEEARACQVSAGGVGEKIGGFFENIFQPKTPGVEESFWDKYKLYIIAIPLALVLILLAVWLVLHFTRKKKIVYNINELKEWVRKEQSMGTSKEDIKQILSERTGWKEEEIEGTFRELAADKSVMKK